MTMSLQKFNKVCAWKTLIISLFSLLFKRDILLSPCAAQVMFFFYLVKIFVSLYSQSMRAVEGFSSLLYKMFNRSETNFNIWSQRIDTYSWCLRQFWMSMSPRWDPLENLVLRGANRVLSWTFFFWANILSYTKFMLFTLYPAIIFLPHIPEIRFVDVKFNKMQKYKYLGNSLTERGICGI